MSGRRNKITSREIARLYLTGGSLHKVAATVKLNAYEVRKILVQAGVPIRSRGAIAGASHVGKLTFQQREQLCADLRSGKFPTMVAIARKYGLSRERVRQNAAAIGVARYSKENRAEAFREKERQREAAAAATRAAREAICERLRKAVARLWQSGVTLREITRVLGFKNLSAANHLISCHRSLSPADFPNRRARRAAPEEIQERKRVTVARIAARREQSEKRRVRLAELWQTGAMGKEIASALGVRTNAVEQMIRRYRQRWPADFPPRILRKRKAD